MLVASQEARNNKYKLNVDVSQDAQVRIGMGFIIRDMMGTVIACGGRSFYFPCSSILVEANALRYALLSIQHLSLLPFVPETDALQLVQEWHTLRPMEQELRLLIDDAKDLASSIGTRTLQYCRREVNKAAHLLEK
ncbi:hypothetical protein Ancab_014730 [Ancistrocladus abbreviatus]